MSIRIICTSNINSSSTRQVCPKFLLIKSYAGNIAGIHLEIIPGDLLGLGVERSKVGIARIGLGTLKALVDQLVDAQNGFAEPSVADEDAEPLKVLMDLVLESPRIVPRRDHLLVALVVEILWAVP